MRWEPATKRRDLPAASRPEKIAPASMEFHSRAFQEAR